MDDSAPLSRKEHILRSLAHMLETAPGSRITTAALAAEVGVSEAALYRHFPSKARMFEGLIAFIEDTLFTRIGRIVAEETSTLMRCEKMLLLLLTFTDKNPGISRILIGDALAGEIDRLRERVSQIFDRIETQFRQVLREARLRDNQQASINEAALANLLMAYWEGRTVQFVRSEFKRSPLENWDEQWSLLRTQLLTTP
ncbi:MAG: hypothetical protein RLZZ385_2718 [Pseudomonadota bacterium]|jgi:TetR/AcrR family transcriptional regulator